MCECGCCISDENGDYVCIELEPNDIDFIAHAREDVPYLLDEIARMRAQIEELRKR